MNIAMTGITGLVGSHLVKQLYGSGPEGKPHNVKALIRETSIVEHLKAYEDVDYIIGDLGDKDSLKKLVEGADVLIHLAHYPGPVQTSDELVQVNVNGTCDLLEAAKSAKVKQVIFLSACAIFGEVLPSVAAESPLNPDHPVRPGTLYGAIKSAIEAFCFFHQRSRSFDVTILRPVTIYGVRPEINKSEWFQTVDFLATNYNVDLKGSTKYVSVDTVVQAIMLSLGNKETAGNVYHLVDGHIHNMDLGYLIVEIIDSFGEVEGAKGQEGVPMDNQAAKDLGVEFKGLEGIKEYIKLIYRLQMEYGGERQVQNW
ncbi:MAG: NAD-dependent epimerase/dehydratase family protein [Nitrospinales bacterium]